MGTITVRKGDNPSVLAKNFCKTYGCKNAVSEIEEKIKEQLTRYYNSKEFTLSKSQTDGMSALAHSGEPLSPRMPVGSVKKKTPKVLFNMEVEIDKFGKKGRLIVYEGVNVRALARSFVLHYKISPEAEETLVHLITENMKKFQKSKSKDSEKPM